MLYLCLEMVPHCQENGSMSPREVGCEIKLERGKGKWLPPLIPSFKTTNVSSIAKKGSTCNFSAMSSSQRGEEGVLVQWCGTSGKSCSQDSLSGQQ